MSKQRDWVNNNSAIVTIVAVLVLIAALVWIIKDNMPGRKNYQPIDVYFYDMGSTAPDQLDRLFSGKSNQLPPIPAPSGKMINDVPAGVRAWVFACGDCKDRSKFFIGYLETYTKEAKDMIENASKTPPNANGKPPGFAPEFMQAQMDGHRISVPDSDNWVPMMSQGGYKIQQDIQTRCPDPAQRPVPCNPAK